MPTAKPVSTRRRLAQLAFSSRHGASMRMLDGIGGPTPIAVLGNAELFSSRLPFEVMQDFSETYGPLVRFWLFEKPSLLVNEPSLIHEILVTRADDYWKNNPGPSTRPVMGRSLFTMPGGDDQVQRRKRHPLSRADIEQWYDASSAVVVREVARRLREAGPIVDLYDVYVHASFDACCETLLGTRLAPEWFGIFHRLMEEISSRGVVPISPSPRFWWLRRRWFSLIEARVAEAATAPSNRTDLLAWLARAGGQTLAQDQLRDEIATTFAAGMRNIAATAASATWLLHANPETLRPVRAELGRPSLAELSGRSFADWQALPVLRRTMSEVLRLHAVVPGFVREVVPGRGTRLAGHLLPDGTQLFIVPWVTHRDPRFWPDPLRFDPDRFLTTPARATYLPFGWGARSCIGDHLTIHFARLMVATVLSEAEVSLVSPAAFEITSMAGTIYPKGGIPARLTLRAS